MYLLAKPVPRPTIVLTKWIVAVLIATVIPGGFLLGVVAAVVRWAWFWWTERRLENAKRALVRSLSKVKPAPVPSPTCSCGFCRVYYAKPGA